MLIDDIIIIIIYVVFTSIAITVNVILLFIMIRHTPKSFANFGIVMKFHVVCDIHTILSAFAVMNRTIPIGHSIAFIAYGPCSLVSTTVCYLVYGCMAAGASMTPYILLVSFAVRLQIMRNKKPSDRCIIALLLSLTFPLPTSILALFTYSRSDDSIMQLIFSELFPENTTLELSVFGVDDTRKGSMATALSFMIAVIIPVYALILMLRFEILKCLHEKGVILSEKTKAMHAKFVKMLTLQCVVPPVVFTLTLAPFELELHEVFRHPIVEAMINVLACLSTLLSPIIVLLHVSPYRRAFVRMVKSKGIKGASPNSMFENSMLLERNAE